MKKDRLLQGSELRERLLKRKSRNPSESKKKMKRRRVTNCQELGSEGILIYQELQY